MSSGPDGGRVLVSPSGSQPLLDGVASPGGGLGLNTPASAPSSSEVLDGHAASHRLLSSPVSPSEEGESIESSLPRASVSPAPSRAATGAHGGAPLTLWQRAANRAARAFEYRKHRQLRRREWGWCSLAFPSQTQENIFLWYFGQLREKNMRGGMLALTFCYILYATIEWRDQAGFALTISRAVYVALILALFTFSYAKPTSFRMHLQEWTMSVALCTAACILVEALLLEAPYSPFVVIILLLFLLGASVLVRLRFAYTTALGLSTLIMYDLLCLLRFRDGDTTYNLILLFAILVVMKLSHRVEIQSRYEFLSTWAWSERRARERRKRRAEQRAALQAGGTASEAVQPRMMQVKPLVAADGSTVAATQLQGDEQDEERKDAPPALPPLSPSPSPDPIQHFDFGLDSEADEWSASDDEGTLLDLDSPLSAAGAGGVDESIARAVHESVLRRVHDLLFVQTRQTDRHLAREHAAEEEAALAAEGMEAEGDHHHADGGTLHLSEDGLLHPLERAASARSNGSVVGSRNRSRRPSLRASESSQSMLPDRSSDIMAQITRALQQSGAGDMRSFLHLLASKPPEQRARSSASLVAREQLPSYFLPYPYITSAYRVHFTPQQCLRSIFRWHNETLNIWSEFLPAFVCFVLFWYVMIADPVLAHAPPTDRVLVALGLLGALVLRPLCSGLAHTFYCQSERSYVLWWGVDYVSICVCVLATCTVFGRFTFACLPEQQSFFYVSLVGLFLSTIISVVFVSSAGVRTGSFLLFILFATGVPLFYAISLKFAGGAENDVPFSYISGWLISLGLLAAGLVVKSSGFPECLTAAGCCSCAKPGAFDVFGASHFFWHCFVNAGNIMAYFVWRDYLQWRSHTQCH